MRLLPVAAILLVAAGCTDSRAAKSSSQPAEAKPAATAPASTPEEAKAAEDKKAAEAKAADEKKAADAQAAEDRKAAEAKAADEKKAAAAKAAEEKAAAAQAAKDKAAEEKRAADAKAAEEKAAKAKAAEEKRLAEAKAAEEKAAEAKAAKTRTAEEKAAKAKADEDKRAADEAKAAEEKAAKAKAAADRKAAEAEARATRSAPAGGGSWGMKSGGDGGGQYSELQVGEGAVLRLRYIPPGSYTQGSEPGDSPWRLDDEMAHPVSFSRGFWLAETETTQAVYQAVTGANPSQFTDPAKPVDSVSWHEAESFINLLNGKFAGLNARLPSEAEWEYACRAGSTGPFADAGARSDKKGAPQGMASVGWTLENSAGSTHPAGMLAANAWGLRDMHGNVMEWCQDAYANYPASASDPKLVSHFGARVVRGGSWRHPEWTARSAARRALDSAVADNSLGFRILVPAKQ